MEKNVSVDLSSSILHSCLARCQELPLAYWLIGQPGPEDVSGPGVGELKLHLDVNMCCVVCVQKFSAHSQGRR